jgi:broad specificity phosphatase PhoE
MTHPPGTAVVIAALWRWENEGGARAPERVLPPNDLGWPGVQNTASSLDWPRLHLIRHGETFWSITGQHTGRTDIALTVHGEDEARGLRSFLSRIHFTAVLTSPLLRARQTCELAGLGSVCETDPHLTEWNYGDYEGKRTEDIRQHRLGWNVWRDGCPRGETPADVSDRADRLLMRLRTLRGDVALFSHGQFGSALAARWIGLPLINGQHFALAPASISVLAYEPGHPTVPAIVLWNFVPATLATLQTWVGEP